MASGRPAYEKMYPRAPATCNARKIGLPVARERRPDLLGLMISAYRDTGTMDLALARGAQKFLTKPVDFPQLKQSVMQVIADSAGEG